MFPPCFQVLGKATLCDRAESPYRKNPGLTIFLSVNLRFLLQLLLEEKTSVLVTFTFQCNLTTNYILPCKSLKFRQTGARCTQYLDKKVVILIVFSLEIFQQPVIFLFGRHIVHIKLALYFRTLQFYRLLQPFRKSFDCCNPQPDGSGR